MDDLSVGPIADVVGQARRTWWMDFYAGDEGEEISEWAQHVEFWDLIATSSNLELMVWMTRHSVMELTAFGEFLICLPKSKRFKLADFTSVNFRYENKINNLGRVGSLGVLVPNQLERGFEIAKSVARDDFLSDMLNWRQLKKENALQRRFDGDRVCSESVEYFDPLILKWVLSEWQPLRLVVRNCYAYLRNRSDRLELSVLSIHRRLEALEQLGKVEVSNNTKGTEELIRLPPTSPS